MTAAEFQDAKIPKPSGMTSRQWEVVQLELRERAFFMSCVADGEILQIFQDVTARYVKGEITESDARQEIRERLQKAGYAPNQGKEGTIKDLSGLKRLDVVLRTNAQMAAGKAQYEKQLRAIKVFPAKQMVRLRIPKKPRDWNLRWAPYAGDPGVNAAEKAALITSPVWVKLSRFSAPYPPYDWGSGMGDRALRKDEAKALGLPPIPNGSPSPAGGIRIEGGEAVVKPSLNETLEADPEITSPAIKDHVAENLTGLARWEGDKLVSLDPNGTKPVTSAELAEVIGTENNAGIPLMEKSALQQWIQSGIKADDEAMEWFRRLVRRVIPMDGSEPLHFQRNFTTLEGQQAIIAKLQEGQRWTPAPQSFPFTPFSAGAGAAEATAEQFPVIFRVIKHINAKDLSEAAERLADADPDGPYVLFEKGASFLVDSIEEQNGAAIINFTEEGA